MSIVELRDLHFAYQKRQPILEGLSLKVPAGSIYGFLGANGAGKSTTLRNLLGLLRPQRGEIRLFGEALYPRKAKVFQRIGSLIESPSLYPQLSAEENLALMCRYRQLAPQSIDRVLEQVGLSAHRKRKAGKFSTGMKQRLGLALSLIHDPDLLILDEPTNGLDPNGISEMRTILQNLNLAGKTIVLSSHLLSEIERMASHVGIIREGKMLFEGSLSDLQAWREGQCVVALDLGQGMDVETLLTGYQILGKEDHRWLIQLDQQAMVPGLVRHLVAAGVEVFAVEPQKSDLEKMFMELTRKADS